VHLHPIPGGLWLAGPEQAAAPLRALRGFGYLRELLRRPHQPIAALDLVGAGTGVVVQPGTGDLLDRQALQAYRQRLHDLDQDLAEAEQWSDMGKLDAVRAERDALLDQLAAATGLGGRARSTGASRERARIAVKKAIGRLGTLDQPLAQHLRISIQTGLSCTYRPDPRDVVDWILD
jgi:uncharacterized membrane protein